MAEEVTRSDAARGVAAELHSQLEQEKESHAREVRSLREELKELSGAAAGDERRQGGSRKKPRLEKRDRTSGSSDRSSA